MTPEEAKARVDASKAKLRGLEGEVARLATMHVTPVLLAMFRVLVEMVCASQGPNFVVFHKIKFYEAVIRALREKGVA